MKIICLVGQCYSGKSHFIEHHFKPKIRNTEPNMYKQQKILKYLESHHKCRYITGHYHTPYHSKDGRIVLAPWKLYYFDKLIK